MAENVPTRTAIPHGTSFNPKSSGRRNERQRSTRACDKCRKSKTKCSGDQPCIVCIAIGLEHQCTYNLPYSRGLPPRIPRNPARDQNSLYSHPNPNGIYSRQILHPRHREEPRQLLPKLGPDGKADATMASHQQRLSDHISMFGDLPMPNNQSRLVALPNKDVGAQLIATYFNEVSPSMLFLHLPSVELWASELLSDDGYELQNNELRGENAIALLVFASAQAYLSGSETTGFDPSMRYFQLADEQLQLESGPPKLTSIQARLLQCQYLLARGRINQCWSTFGTVINLIYALRIQRKCGREGLINLVHTECQKRVFWAAFTFDKYLSYALNDRPQRIDFENTDQHMPKFLEDRQLSSSFLMPLPKDTLSKIFASNMQIELGIIISKILKDVYGLYRPNIKTHLKLAKAYTTDLSLWKDKASPLIHAPLDILIKDEFYKVQRAELLLAYHHARILLLRNFMLDSHDGCLVSDDDEDVENTPTKEELEAEVDEIKGTLVQACLLICEIIEVRAREFEKNDKIELTQSLWFRSAWFTQYVMYSAAVVIYINGHQEIERLATQTNCMILKKAYLLHRPLRALSHPGTFIGKCASVLDELKDALDDALKKYRRGKRKMKNGIAEKGNAKNGHAKNGDAKNKDASQDAESTGNASEYEGAEDMVITISSDDGSDDGSGTLSGNGYRDEDTHMMNLQRNDGDTNGGVTAVGGKLPIMQRIDKWGFARLTGEFGA